ncbi:MAG TPA: TRAP transporter substrate-binding protein DctP [Deferrisomatales bacterium]|nr:TRAP transporter substrate-binding protein DctP [Deferrisomatales bacterium]
MSAATAGEVTLKAVSAFNEGTAFSRNFERFVKKVNDEGKGLVQINYVGGGGKVMNPFELGNALRSGVVDMANDTGAFYTNLAPEADALKLCEVSSQTLRKNGGWELVNELHNKKLNGYYLARQGIGVPFHLYLTKPISKPDLTGFKIRITPVYQAFFEKLGATVVRTAPGEVYTALERGTVDGYGWPIQGVLDLGWQEVTKYRVDPGFYNVDVGVLVNLDTWNSKLDEAQRAFLVKMGLWLESLDEEAPKINEAESQKQQAAGIQTITFTGDDRSAYLKAAYEAGWAKIMAVSPEYGPKLKQVFTK